MPPRPLRRCCADDGGLCTCSDWRAAPALDRLVGGYGSQHALVAYATVPVLRYGKARTHRLTFSPGPYFVDLCRSLLTSASSRSTVPRHLVMSAGCASLPLNEAATIMPRGRSRMNGIVPYPCWGRREWHRGGRPWRRSQQTSQRCNAVKPICCVDEQKPRRRRNIDINIMRCLYRLGDNRRRWSLAASSVAAIAFEQTAPGPQ